MNSFEVFKWLDLNIYYVLPRMALMKFDYDVQFNTVQKQFPGTINFKWYKILSSMSSPSLKRHLTMEKKDIKYTG